jgi:hypothetical protein
VGAHLKENFSISLEKKQQWNPNVERIFFFYSKSLPYNYFVDWREVYLREHLATQSPRLSLRSNFTSH